MPTSTTICNEALDALGKPHLTLLGSDDSTENDLCDAAFEGIRDQVYREHPWNCCMKRAILAENLLLQSESFDNSSWVKTNVTVTANQVRAPDGLTTMDLLDDSDAGNAGTVVQAITVPNDSKNHTRSIHLQEGTAAVTRLRVAYSGGTGITKDVDITWGSSPSISSGAIESIGGGIFRITMTFANNGTGNTTFTVTTYPAGATASATGTVYAWGDQVTQSEGKVGYAATTTIANRPAFPLFEYKFSWDVPVDWIRHYDTDLGDLAYKIEGRTILTNLAEVPIRYIFQQTDYNVVDPLLLQIIALRLAKRISIPLHGSDERKKEIGIELLRAESRARTIDAQEDGEDSFVEDSWVSARWG